MIAFRSKGDRNKQTKRAHTAGKRPNQHSRKHSNNAAITSNAVNLAKKNKKNKKHIAEKGENQVIVFVSPRHKHNNIMAAKNVLPRTNKHSQNANTEQQQKKQQHFDTKQNKYGKKKHGKKGNNTGTTNCDQLWRARNLRGTKTQGMSTFVVVNGHKHAQRSSPLERKKQKRAPPGALSPNEK